MDPTHYQKSTTGRVVRVAKGISSYYAFMPHALPDALEDLELDAKLIQLLSEANLALGRLSGIGFLVPNADFLVILYTRLEALSSSRIEGTQASLSELFYFEAASEEPPRPTDLAEVCNYLLALNNGLERLNTLPLSLRLVREIHENLMSGVRGGTPERTPGEFRRSQNWIGPAGCTLQDATYVPPPYDELMYLLGDWETFLHKEDFPILLQCALMHYQFEAIHPFLDGNGRVGRLLITLFLCARDVLPYPLLYLSAYFEQHRAEYYHHLLAVSQTGDWTGWFSFFLRGVLLQSNHAIESAKRIVQQREHYRFRLQNKKASSSVLALLDQIFMNPYVTANQAANKLNVSYQTASKAISFLEELHILEEITGQRRNRIYVARELLHLLAENEPIYRPQKKKS